MSTAENITAQQKILATHRRTLALYLMQQAAQGGVSFAQAGVVNGIAETRAEILHCKETLRSWGVTIENHPDDEAVTLPSAVDVAQANQSSPSERAGAGLEALAELMRAQEARSAVAAYLAHFQIACRQIEVLSGYKKLHDLFQQLDDRYIIIIRFSKGLPANQAAWEDVERDEPELYVTAEALLKFAMSSLFASEAALWSHKLSRAQRELRSALEMYDAQLLKDALGRFKEVVDRQLSRANTRLVGAAEALDLVTLVTALRTVCDQLASLKLGSGALRRLDDFRLGVEALAELERRLTTAIGLHTRFQDVDDELRLIESLLAQDASNLVDAWQDLHPMLCTICENNPADWATMLMRLEADLEAALQAADPLRIRRCFSRYRSQAGQSFNQVDHDLLSLCAELQQVGAPLDRVLRVME